MTGVADHFSSLSAPARVAALADPGTVTALAPATQRPAVWTGAARIAGHRILLAATDGHHRGGTVGVEEASALSRLIATAARRRPAAVVLCWDTGGVRVQEGSPALAAASAVGVALTRLDLLGTPVITVVSGPRGCFGAPAVIAATARFTIATRSSHWGLTGPKLLDFAGARADETEGRAATAAVHRRRAKHVMALAADSAAAIRSEIAGFLAKRQPRPTAGRTVDASVARTRSLSRGLRARRAAPVEAEAIPRRRDLFRFSFRGHWQPAEPALRRGCVHASWGKLDGQSALGIIVGYERSRAGIGIEEAHAVTQMVRFAVRRARARPAPIVSFLFCRGHTNDLEQERAGLHCALAECLRSLTVARLRGHPLLCVLGGGAYGAAYLAFAAPSHRILAIRGTTVAPMAPRVLAAFRKLRGMSQGREAPRDLAQLIPEIRIVESVVRLPKALHEELAAGRAIARPEMGASGGTTRGGGGSRLEASRGKV